MKRFVVFIVILVCMLGLVACDQSSAETDTGALPPMITLNGENYFAGTMPIPELPDDFEYMGEITSDEANDTGLEGCKYYANKYISSFDIFYVYQECGTPIDENTLDNVHRQWAYVKWVREGFGRD